jgi:hypothetical protein
VETIKSELKENASKKPKLLLTNITKQVRGKKGSSGEIEHQI